MGVAGQIHIDVIYVNVKNAEICMCLVWSGDGGFEECAN